MNWAETAMGPFAVTVQVRLVPEQAPDHELKMLLSKDGVDAVRVTVAPAGTAALADGHVGPQLMRVLAPTTAVTVPLPVPPFETVSV